MSMSLPLNEENYSLLSSCPVTDEESNLYCSAALSVVDTEYGMNYLLGNVLTIVDASIIDPVQRKAVKDLIKNKFHLALDNFKAQVKSPLLSGSIE